MPLKFVDHFWKMYENFKSSQDKYDFPFPMAVFGTLRKNYSNNVLMGKNIKDSSKSHGYRYIDAKYSCRSKGFIPHMLPTGLWLEYCKNCSGVIEVFIYNKYNWNKMINGVDSLEGFHPGRHHGGYNRTLVKARLLPKTYDSILYKKPSDSWHGLTPHRDLGIVPSTWNDYIELPVWIYANNEVNLSVSRLSDSSILWHQ